MDIEQRKADSIFIEDCWVKIYAMHLMCPCPISKAKDMFIEYVLHEHTTDLILAEFDGADTKFINEDYVMRQYPNFINYLVYSRA
tara:strand:- start:33 stop:287 length:255 start_codon:yes stop_codon:yes gene_type:complete